MKDMKTSITTKIDGLDKSLRDHVQEEIKKSEKKTDARIDESWEKNTKKFDTMNSRIAALEQSAAAAETEAARHRLALTQSLRKQNVLFVGNLSKDTTLEELKTLANTVLDGTNKKFEKCELLSKAGEPLGQALIHFVKSDGAKTFRDQFRAKGPTTTSRTSRSSCGTTRTRKSVQCGARSSISSDRSRSTSTSSTNRKRKSRAAAPRRTSSSSMAIQWCG